MKTAFLIHLLRWQHQSAKIELSPKVSICRTLGSLEHEAYVKLCEKYGIHDGEPLDFYTHVLTDSDDYYLYAGHESPYLDISKICTIITILTKLPIESCFAIMSKNNFKTVYWFSEYYGSHFIYEYFYKIYTKPNDLDFSMAAKRQAPT